MNELKNRGAGDILIAVVDGLKGFPEALATAKLEGHLRSSRTQWSFTDRNIHSEDLALIA